jgi:hypothetical protein
VQAEEKTLTAEEAQALFSNKTFDGFNEEKGKSFKVFSSADGVHNLQKSNGKMKKGAWRIDKRGRHCVEFKNEKCSKVVTEGDGVYKKITYGEHTHTLKNFVDGDQL